MRYQLKARVNTVTYSLKPVSAEIGPYLVTFFTDIEKSSAESMINWVTISRKIENYSDYLPKLTPHALDHGTHNLTYNPPIQIREEMLKILHYFESMGSFWFKIKSIDINQLEDIWIPESDIERSSISVNNFYLGVSYPSTPAEIKVDNFQKVIRQMQDFDYLTIPLAFFRSGELAFSELNYFFAYLSFFLFLDGLFSKGQFHQIGLKKSFKDSKILMDSITKVVHYFSQNENHEKRMQLEGFFKSRNKSIDTPEDVVDFIIETRGELAHFSLHNSRKNTHLLNQHSFQPVAFMMLSICMQVICKVGNEASLRNEILDK